MKQLAIEFSEGADRSTWVTSDTQRVSEAGAWALGDRLPPTSGLLASD